MKKFTATALLLFGLQLCMAQGPALVVKWDNSFMVSKSTPTLQVVGNPMLRRGASMHDGSFGALKDLGADYVRYVPWFPYPKLVVAELNAPDSGKTSSFGPMAPPCFSSNWMTWTPAPARKW